MVEYWRLLCGYEESYCRFSSIFFAANHWVYYMAIFHILHFDAKRRILLVYTQKRKTRKQKYISTEKCPSFFKISFIKRRLISSYIQLRQRATHEQQNDAKLIWFAAINLIVKVGWFLWAIGINIDVWQLSNKWWLWRRRLRNG